MKTEKHVSQLELDGFVSTQQRTGDDFDFLELMDELIHFTSHCGADNPSERLPTV